MPTVGASTSLLQTKLYRPSLTEDYLPRWQLQDLLEQIVHKPLTLVSAPAGYGKSTLLSGWLAQSAVSAAWLSLDENDNDLDSFATYFLGAVRSRLPGFGENILAMLGGVNPLHLDSFVQLFCMELDRLQEDFVLVLDDYQLIRSAEIHALVSNFFVHPHPNFHLALLTRHDPPLPLNNYRARNQLVEIRSSDLRFSLEETGSFLRNAVGQELEEAAITALNRKTEGWASGLRLAALSFARIEGFQDQIANLNGSNMYIMDYLLNQVFGRLTVEMQSFLIQSSLLDRFSAPLCQVVIAMEIDVAVVQTMLQELEAANIFIIPLDDQREWYRYHHLFQHFLQMRLEQEHSPQDIASLHRRASTWFAGQGFIEEALQHALASGDVEAAVHLVAVNRHDLIEKESYQRLSRWLGMFPQQVIEASPDLLLIQARFAQTVRVDIAELAQLVGKIDALIERLDLEPHKTKLLTAENDTHRAVVLFYTLDLQNALTFCSNALAGLPQDWYVIRSYCWMFGAAALQMMGDLNKAYEWIEFGRREDLSWRGRPKARNAAAGGFVSWVAGNLTDLINVGEFMLGISSASKYWETRGWANHFLACAYYHRNNLEKAQHHAQETFNNRHFHPSANVHSAFILIMIQQALGNSDEARELLKLTLDFAIELRSPAFTYLVHSFQGELAVLQGRGQEQIPWAEQAYANMQFAPMTSFYEPSLTIAKVLLAAGNRRGYIQAADCLQRLRDFAESTHNQRILIEVLALEAILHAAQDNEQAALAALERSLSLAQSGGFIRLFVDLGPNMAHLLRSLRNHTSHRVYVATILSAFPDAAEAGQHTRAREQLIEPLTEREDEILALLAKRYTNQEIAAQLFISPATVKRHTINIYQKLSVHSRREAVEAAQSLGLISFT